MCRTGSTSLTAQTMTTMLIRPELKLACELLFRLLSCPPPVRISIAKMGGKAKMQTHTAKECAQKAFAASVNRGGGSAGAADRAGGKAGHAKYKCPVCMQQAPDPKSAEAHWDSKHSKSGAFTISTWADTHAEAGGVTTAGVAVRGAAPDHKRGDHRKLNGASIGKG